jgi:competence protein ComEC
MLTSQYKYSKIPFVRVVLAFIAGIILYTYFPFISVFWNIIAATILTIILIVFQTIPGFRSSYKLSPYWGVGLTIVLIITGYCFSFLHSNSGNITGKSKTGYIIGEIIEQPTEKDKSVKTVLEIQAIKNKNEWEKSEGKVVLYFQKDQRSSALINGDRIVFEPTLQEITNAGNPEEFDYKQYLAFHLITQQAYLKSGHWQLLRSHASFGLFAFADNLRNKLLTILRKNGLKNENYAVASAITLGYTNELDAEVKQSYSATGAMHILSVSGLHVGIIFIVLEKLLFFLSRKKFMRILKAVLIILFLWGYALLTGLSPSVMRAAAMLSFVVVGNTLKQQANIYNSLAVSAFFLLTFNPFLLYDVGFQLSYLAVLGIVYFHPLIYKTLYIKNKWIDKIWVLTSVAIAAQLITVPLSLYYFHQFPNYFLLTGLIVIPLSTFIIYGIIFLFVISPWEWGSAITGKGINLLVEFMNSSIKTIENLPGALTSNISFSSVQVVLFYAALLTVTLFIMSKKIKYLHYFLVSVIIILAVGIYNKLELVKQKKIFVYNIKGISAINFIDGTNNVLFSDIEKQTTKISYALKGNWISLGVEKERVIPFSQMKEQFLFTNLLTTDNKNLFFKKNFFDFYGRRIVVIRENFKIEKSSKKIIPVDYMILSNNVKMEIADLLFEFKPNQIIIDSSNSKWRTDKWAEQTKQLHIPCHIVSENGAFIANI